MTSMARMPVHDTCPERLVLAAERRVYGGPVTTQAALPGTPDFALPELRVAIEAHGCFWHNHAGCPHARIPTTAYSWAAPPSKSVSASGARPASESGGRGSRSAESEGDLPTFCSRMSGTPAQLPAGSSVHPGGRRPPE
ncbi:hypothetical protein [Falsiroseomonas sp. E2-1-a20]|uniref:hypothetical protein n=1 Tax=Falsiroseomonas sp. E2-1-a20 TaxID=3239300 RepID=UPI003F2DD7FA